jgi:hypothetical protein
MQAMGLINDHVEACVIRTEVERARRKFPPTRALTTACAAICCATPILAVVFGALGLTAWLAHIALLHVQSYARLFAHN